jgi:hypothetical protein
MIKSFLLAFLLTNFGVGAARAQTPTPNYDESKVPAYTLPDPLVFASGKPVKTAADWQRRRAELLNLFETQMFGRVPGKPPGMQFELLEAATPALEGKALRKQVAIQLGQGAKIDVLIYLPPDAKGPVPAFVGLNFNGNHTVSFDPGIRLPTSWHPSKGSNHRAVDKQRGDSVRRWPIEMIVARGYAVVTAYYNDIDPDFDDGFQNGVQPLFYKEGQTKPAPDEWGSIGAWAWGLMRIADYLETDKAIDTKRLVLHGHSRLGKTALYAGALDQRFAAVISNDSGEGGAAIARRKFGETTADLNNRFPHWFCANFKQYSGREETLPFDQHELLALIAPRPLYVASAEDDQWADPKGEFLSAKAASPVYKLLGVEGLAASEMPPVNQPVKGRVSYHIRTGKHDMIAYDWEQYLDWADRWVREPKAKK